MKLLDFFNVLLLTPLLTKAFCCRSSSNSLSCSDTPTLSLKIRKLNGKRPSLSMISEPFIEEVNYSPLNVMAAASPAENYKAAPLQQISASQNSQHELSPQQFVYVILTRYTRKEAVIFFCICIYDVIWLLIKRFVTLVSCDSYLFGRLKTWAIVEIN